MSKISSRLLISAVLTSLRKSISLVIIFSLLMLNVLTLTSSTVFALGSSLLSSLPIPHLMENSPIKKMEKKSVHARKVSQRIAKRTIRNVGVNVTSVAAEALPYVGAAVVVSVTAMDVIDGCDTLKDINSLLAEFQFEDEQEDINKVCGYEVPTFEEITQSVADTVNTGAINEKLDKAYETIGATTYYSIEKIKENSRELSESIGGTLYELIH